MKRLIVSLIIFSAFLYPSEKILVRQNNTSINDHGEYFDDILPTHLNNQSSRSDREENYNVNLVGHWGELRDDTSPWVITSFNDTVIFNHITDLYIVDYTNISDPLIIGQTALPDVPHWGSLYFQDDYLYVCNSYAGFRIYDFTDFTYFTYLSKKLNFSGSVDTDTMAELMNVTLLDFFNYTLNIFY